MLVYSVYDVWSLGKGWNLLRSLGRRGVAGLPKDAASRLATDDIRAKSPDPDPPGPGGARRLASALRSQPLSINFRAADGCLTEQLG